MVVMFPAALLEPPRAQTMGIAVVLWQATAHGLENVRMGAIDGNALGRCYLLGGIVVASHLM